MSLFKIPTAEQIEREMAADLVSYAKAWDGIIETLFGGRKPEPATMVEEAQRMDDEEYCALHCPTERRSWEDCALVHGCPLERES